MNDIQFGEGTFDDLYGHKIIELKENFIRTEIKITSDLHQPMGLVHGGLYSSMAEAAISYAAYLLFRSVYAYGWLTSSRGRRPTAGTANYP